jgi:hypothetical protein
MWTQRFVRMHGSEMNAAQLFPNENELQAFEVLFRR